MSILSNPAFGPRLAIGYVTVGALIDVWTAVWYFAFAKPNEAAGGLSNSTWFWVVGFFLTGLTLIVLGLLIGPLGQYARKSELPPPEAKGAEAQIQQNAASAPVVQAQPGTPGMVAPTQVPRQPGVPVVTNQVQSHAM